MGGVQGRVQLCRRLLRRLSLAAGGLLAPAGGARRLNQTNAVIGCNNFAS